MKVSAIPAWTAEGVLPPVHALNPMASARSPYPVSLTDFVLRFGTSAARRAILAGYLQYREALHAAGIVSGFQWLDGSFIEDIEDLESRAPNDVDVVTFFRLPVGLTQRELWASAPALFTHAAVKRTYHVDAYLEHLGTRAERLVLQSAYWYSVWSHRRGGHWKGFVAIDLAPADDLAAATLLTSLADGDAP
jgi:hypothetical protein